MDSLSYSTVQYAHNSQLMLMLISPHSLYRILSSITQIFHLYVQCSLSPIPPPNPPQLMQSNPIINPPKKNQSQLPSLHPVLHLSSHLSQSNFCFPNFPFTALCASHIHLPNSSRLLTRGAFAALFSLIHARKSSAQTPHGYNFPNRWRNCRVSVCCEGVGWGG